MNYSDKSNNNNDKSINNNYNGNNIASLILAISFFTSCFNVFKLMFLFIELGNLFHTEGEKAVNFIFPYIPTRKVPKTGGL